MPRNGTNKENMDSSSTDNKIPPAKVAPRQKKRTGMGKPCNQIMEEGSKRKPILT